MAAATAAVNAVKNKMPVGGVEKYLPNFHVILKRTPNLPPTHASFVVPLWFNKLDLRDYLWQAYGVRTIGGSVRVYVKQGQVIEGNPALQMPAQKQWRRTAATKHMTVQLAEPFVWPTPTAENAGEGESNEDPWRLEERKNAEAEGNEYMRPFIPTSKGEADKARREALRAQARDLLAGKEKWRPGMGRGW